MISFQNDGLLDVRALKTFGVSVKETENPIGYFGTGFKYAISVILRNRGEITVWIGKEPFRFSVKIENIRGKDFNLICMNGAEMGFTTDLGKNWHIWQAFRELYCNCKDEPNPVITNKAVEPAQGKTTVQVEGAQFEEVFANRKEYFLERNPEYQSGGVNFHAIPGEKIFYKGVRVGDLKTPSNFTYDISGRNITLTEDRAIAWYWEPLMAIARAVMDAEDSDLIQNMLTAPFQTFESELDYDIGHEPGQTFMRVMRGINFKELTNFTARKVFKKYSGQLYSPDSAPLKELEKLQLAKAQDFLENIGFPVKADSVIVTTDLPENILGCVYEKQIYISRRVFMMGTQQVASCLLEEHLHLRKGYKDETREMQTFLFDLVISLGEQLEGKPL